MNEYEFGTTVRLSAVFRDFNQDLIDPTTVTLTVTKPSGTVSTVSSINNPSQGNYYGYYTTDEEGDHAYEWVGEIPAISFVEVQTGFFVVIRYDVTGLDYLIPVLRFYLGDINAERYTTETLRQALIFSVRMLMRRWNGKYLVDEAGTVTRNPHIAFSYAEPPTIQYEDEPPIVIQAAIIIKSGSLQEATWQTASWRDDEIQVSNIQGQRSREKALDKDIELLDLYFKLRLYAGMRQPLPGFKYPPNWREG